MKRALIPALALLLAGCQKVAEEPVVGQAWVRLPAVPGQPGAAYFTLKGGRHDTRLVRIESALVGHVELHESMSGMGGMSSMKPLDGVDVGSGQTVTFAPGGKHAMLMGVDPVVKAGTSIPLRFGFADGKTAEAEAKTVAPGSDAPY